MVEIIAGNLIHDIFTLSSGVSVVEQRPKNSQTNALIPSKLIQMTSRID